MLYPWEKADGHQLLDVVCQQLVEGVDIDTTSMQSHLKGSKRKEKRANSDENINMVSLLKEEMKNNSREILKSGREIEKTRKLKTHKLIHGLESKLFEEEMKVGEGQKGTNHYKKRAKYIRKLEQEIADLQAQLFCDEIDDIES